MDIKEKIQQYLDYKRINTNQLETSIGVSKSYWRKTKSISANIVVEICRIYPDLNIEWVFTDKGKMLKTEDPEKPSSSTVHGNVKDSVVGGGVLNKNIYGNDNNVGIMPADCERELMKARAEIEFLKKTLKEKESQSKIKVENMLKQHNQEKESLKNQLEQAIEERNRSLVDKDRAIAMLEKALSR